ncbi:MAG: hypothetical protein QGH29_04145, partial [Kiritimatiellia bacterium]|nr:hypothetical protein [Kiritimatiellia bacterium]
MPRRTLTIVLLSLVLAAPLLADAQKTHHYDIVKAGKLTQYARFVGSFHPQRDQKDDGTFTFGNLHNFLYAGAGFT